MNDDDLFALVKRVDPRAVRLPPGIKEIAVAIEAAERERCAKLCEGSAFKDGITDARRGPDGVGTWHETSPLGYAMRNLAKAIRQAPGST